MALTSNLQLKFYQGFMYKFREKSAILSIQVDHYKLPIGKESSNIWFSAQSSPDQQASELVLAAINFKLSCFRRGKIPVFSQPRVISARYLETGGIIIICAFTYWSAELSAKILRAIFLELNQLAEKSATTSHWAMHIEKYCELYLSEILSHQNLFGTNNYHLLDAAVKQNIEVNAITSSTYQLGFGPRARWFESTQTDLTSGISLSLVKNKDVCNLFLKRNGFPVPQQIMLRSRDACANALKKFSGAVVVKPADRDGGVGITSNLKELEAVHAAYDKAAALSHRVIMESYAEGNDYRLTFFRGDLCRCFGRRKQGVIGDGEHSIRDLIAAHNERKRDQNKSIIADDPLVTDRLARLGLDLDKIPAQGDHVVLGELHNVSVGGILFPVSASQIHPDNILLGRLAAKLTRLDIIGIDMITSDIGKSWKEAGLVITELNGVPQIGSDDPTVFDNLIFKLLSDNREKIVSVCIILADVMRVNNQLAPLVELEETVVANASLYQSGSDSCRRFPSTFDAAQHALNLEISRLYILMTIDELTRFGFPCCSFDEIRWDEMLENHPAARNFASWSADYINKQG